jgi:hypothetical protein
MSLIKRHELFSLGIYLTQALKELGWCCLSFRVFTMHPCYPGVCQEKTAVCIHYSTGLPVKSLKFLECRVLTICPYCFPFRPDICGMCLLTEALPHETC